MPRKKPGLTLEQHKKTGADLHEIYCSIQSISCTVSRAYSFKMSDPLHKALEVIKKLKGQLCSKVHEENPGKEGLLSIYYPNTGNGPQLEGQSADEQ